MQPQRWIELMSRLGLSANDETYQALRTAYTEPHRHYHNDQHIKAVLRYLDEVRSLATNPDEIELALWFHDAIYKPFSSTNEKDSADWAAEFLKQNEGDEAMIKRIHRLIMVTAHTADRQTTDEQLIVDIDLSILGSDVGTYHTFEANVRKEYRQVPLFIYKRKRKALLRDFLKRTRIYGTDYFYQRFEQQARDNLVQVLG